MSKSKILFMMSGSIAAFKACQLISRLVQLGHEVRVVTTKSTAQFIGPATLEGLTGHKVLSDLWEEGHAMDHIHLTRWADFAILCPATANTIARLASGMADDLVAAMTLAWPTDKKFWLVPAMNQQMIRAQVTQENLAKLAARGFQIAPTQSGPLACGEEGLGRMLEAEQILELILSASSPSPGALLITGGATREPIDGIRFLSNVSTGQTAATLADRLEAKGWRVTFMHGQASLQPQLNTKNIAFGSFSDLNEKLRGELGRENYVGVIHCAAVSDFSPTNSAVDRKLTSAKELTIQLKPNFKILPHLKEYSRNKNVCVVGFKLTLNEDPAPKARALLGPTIDAVVANEWGSVRADRSEHPGTLFDRHGTAQPFTNLESLTLHLHSLFSSAKGETHDPMS